MKNKKSLKNVTEKVIERLCNITDDEELMETIDLKDLKTLTASIKELMTLTAELEPEKKSKNEGGVIFLPEVNLKSEE